MSLLFSFILLRQQCLLVRRKSARFWLRVSTPSKVSFPESKVLKGTPGEGEGTGQGKGGGQGRSRSRREPSRRAEEKGKGRQEGARRSGRRPEQERDPGTRRSGRAGRGEGRANQQARGEEERGRAAHAATEPEIQMEKVPGPQILASFTLSVPTGRFTFGERLARGHQGEQQEVPGPQILASGAATPHAPC